MILSSRFILGLLHTGGMFLTLSVFAHPVYASRQSLSSEIEKILALPEDRIDIGIAALTFAHDIYPNDTDIAAYSQRIDMIVDEVRQLQADARSRHLPVGNGPDDTILAINEVFYNREGYKYDHSDDAMNNGLNYFMPGTIERKMGICSTMPMLYMAIGQRLGLPLYAVTTPDHNFLRITHPRSKIGNIEVTSGSTASDEKYIKEENISDVAIKHGTYMRTLTHHEYLAILLMINASWYWRHDQEEKAARYYQRALEIDPRTPGAALGLMQINLRKSMKAADDFIFDPQKNGDMKNLVNEYLDRSLSYRNKLGEMGVRMEDLETEQDKKKDQDNVKTQ